MPKITRYGHERQGNVKAAPAMLTPEVVGRFIDVIRAPKHTPCPREEEESIHAELRRCGIQSLADVPATVRGNLDWDLQPYQQQFLDVIGVDLSSSPDMSVEAAYEVTEAGKMALKGVKETASKGRSCRECGCTWTNACVDARGPCWWVEQDLCSHCETPLKGRNGTVIIAEFADHFVDDNKLVGGDHHVVMSSHQSGKTVARDWYVRRNEVLAEAIRFLKARCILVDVVDRTAQIRKYRVSGKRDAMFLEDVVALAESLGFEGAA